MLGASVPVALFLRPGGASSLTGQSARSTNAFVVRRVAAERLLLGTDDGAYESLDGSALAANYSDRHNAFLRTGTEEGVLRTTDKGLTG